MLQYKKTKKSIIFMLLAAVTIVTPVQAEADESAPIHIEADRMLSLEDKNSVIFTGNVDARQGNVIIRSQEMTVYYTQNKDSSQKNTSKQVKKLICKRRVSVTQEDWLGTGERMDYYARDRKVILSGNAKAWQGQNMVAGKTITYYLDEKRSIVEQDPAKQGRVSATLHPDEDRKK